MRSIAHKSVKARAAAKVRKDAAQVRRAARVPAERDLAEFARERDEFMIATILWAVTQRGEHGIAGLRVRQLQVRPDCMLCRRPFTDEERAAAPLLRRRGPRPPVSSDDVAGA